IRDFHVTGVQTCALPILTPSDPTARPEWNADDTLPDRVVLSEPPFGVGGARGVDPWEITPGAPPVRTASPTGRRLLRDATLRREIGRASCRERVQASVRG